MKTLKNMIKDRLNISNSDGIRTLRQRLTDAINRNVTASDERPISDNPIN